MEIILRSAFLWQQGIPQAAKKNSDKSLPWSQDPFIKLRFAPKILLDDK